jgi:hypothetical protein
VVDAIVRHPPPQELSWVHVACTEYLTLMHVGGRSADDIDAGGVLKEFTGTLMRDGYAGYTHLPAVHAWCAAHLVRDLRAVSDADPQTQIWAIAMANTLTEANAAAVAARATGADRLPDATLKQIRNHYRGAIAKGNTDNRAKPGALAAEARKLLRRFTRYEDMILRFATDLSVPFTNNVSERAVRPVKVQQRTSGGAWRTLEGLTNFATVQSYLDTTTKWGIDKHHALQQTLHHRRVATTSPYPQLNSYSSSTRASATAATSKKMPSSSPWERDLLGHRCTHPRVPVVAAPETVRDQRSPAASRSSIARIARS